MSQIIIICSSFSLGYILGWIAYGLGIIIQKKTHKISPHI